MSTKTRAASPPRWSIIVHGGAGAIPDALEAAHRSGCEAAARLGAAILDDGGSAIDAAVAAVEHLEDDPSFNAGVGATLDARGVPALDAAIMRGEDLGYGAVAAVVGVRRPLALARAVLEEGRHCLLVGPGATAFAREVGLEMVDPARLVTERARGEWARLDAAPGDWAPEVGNTVGAVARDAAGHVVAATSTGGTIHRRVGRVGDSPIAGAGTYAEDGLGAASATGHGETMLRTVFAYRAILRLAAGGGDVALVEALEDARVRVGGRGGVIALDAAGRPSFARNTAHMGVAWFTAEEGLASAF